MTKQDIARITKHLEEFGAQDENGKWHIELDFCGDDPELAAIEYAKTYNLWVKPGEDSWHFPTFQFLGTKSNIIALLDFYGI